jgi:DNA-binding PucR family transcriptional regulator
VFESDGAGAAALRAFVAETVNRATHALRRAVIAGIGSTSTDRDRFATSRRDADAALRVARTGGRGSVVHVDDVRTQVAILRLAEVAGADPELRTGLFTSLTSHDQRHGTEYASTAVAYLDARGNVADAASALFVHANTLRYRLRRMAETTGVDVDDTDTRFVLELERRIGRSASP